jgi:hypothetical protein
MNDYRDKGAFWLTCHAHEVALELSGGNPVAAVAIEVLLERINGARVYSRMRWTYRRKNGISYIICARRTLKSCILTLLPSTRYTQDGTTAA